MLEKMNWTRISSGVAGAATLLLFSSAINAQVAGSPHDLSALPGATSNEVCVYCHTPHGADINAPVPLWNKTLPTGTNYQRYSDLETSTLDGQEAPVGSVSLACLSCHDGVQAMDSVLNAPGSGMNSGPIAGNVSMLDLPGPREPVPVLGTDLRDDHPISIQYGGGGASEADGPGITPGDLVDPDFRKPRMALINNNPAWWVDSEDTPNNTRERTDMLLYTRGDGPASPTDRQPFVECGSCHDPHNASTATLSSVAFLRIDNTNSQICTTCHLK
jgi:hypothetical protein